MVLNVHAHCAYPSYKLAGTAWNNDDHRAHQFVQALKGNDFNGYADFRLTNGRSVRIDSENKSLADVVFGEWAAAKVKELGLENATFVPVPSSTCLKIGGDEKGRRLARAITSRVAGAILSERMHWAEQFPKSSAGGPRDLDVLLDNLRFLTDAPRTPIVLVDDVVTTGGHLIACARGLRSYGAIVEHAICAASTVLDRPLTGMFSVRSWDIELALC